VLAALFALAASAHGAGWATNAWPSTTYPRNIDIALSDCWSGTCERVQIGNFSDQNGFGWSLPTGLSWWRSNRGNLIVIKSWLAKIISYSGVTVARPWPMSSSTVAWVNTNALTSTADAGAALTANSGAWPIWNNQAQFLAQCRFPTNYFDFTPYRGTSGCGYPYVTSETLAGGTNYPPGRTNWTTLDYGVARLPTLINSLYATRMETLSATNSRAWGTGSGSTWSAAKTAAENNYSNRVETFWDGRAGTSGWGYWHPADQWTPEAWYSYSAYIHNSVRTWSPDTAVYASGVSNRYEVYVRANHIPYGTPAVGTQVFDRIDFPAITLTNYVFVGSQTNFATITIGSTNRPSTWCDDPGVDPAYGDGLGGYMFAKTLGCSINGGTVAVRFWNVTNGLRYQ